MPNPQPYPTGSQKWQLLKNFIFMGCGPTWAVYFETLLPAVGAAIFMLVDTSVTDVARSVFRPKRVGGRHKRRGRNVGDPFRGGGIPNSEDLIAEYIGGEGLVDTAEYSAGTQNLFRFDALAQEGFYYMLIADLVDDFYYNWISGIISRGPSNCGGIAHLTRTGAAPFSAPIRGFIPLSLATLVSENMCLNSAQDCSMPFSTYCIVLSCKVINNGHYGNPSQYQIRVHNQNATPDPYSYSQRVQLYEGETATLVVQCVVTAQLQTSWEMGVFPVGGFGSEGYFYDAEIRIIDMGSQVFATPP